MLEASLLANSVSQTSHSINVKRSCFNIVITETDSKPAGMYDMLGRTTMKVVAPSTSMFRSLKVDALVLP